MANTSGSTPYNPVDRGLEWWSGYDLSSKRHEWETTHAEVVATIDKSQTSVKGLVEFVKEFRKGSDEEKLSKSDALLRMVQDEVTALVKRSKAAEKAFLHMFTSLAEAPDPAVALASSKDSIKGLQRVTDELERARAELMDARKGAAAKSELAAENSRLHDEIHMLESEILKLQNQDITIRELETRVNEFEQLVDQQVHERLIEREGELKRLFEAELEGVREAETAAESRVLTLKQALADAIAARDEAQAALYALRDEGGNAYNARQQVELESLMHENHLLSTKNAALSAELQMTKQLLAPISANADNQETFDARLDPLAALRAQIDAQRTRADEATEEAAKLRQLLEQLQDESARWQESVALQRTTFESAVHELRATLANKEAENEGLREELRVRPSTSEVANLRNQLSLLHSAVLSSVDGKNANEAGPDFASSGGTGDLDAHMLLVQRIRALESSALRAEEKAQSLAAELTTASAQLKVTLQQNQDLQQQVDKLESALEGNLPTSVHSVETAHKRQLSAESQLTALFPGSQMQMFAPPSTQPVDGTTTELTQLVEVLRGQRDRLKTRMTTLEGEVQSRTAQLADAFTKVQQLNQDNVKLYGKIRYLQSFIGSGGRSGGKSAEDAEDDFEKSYKKLYQDTHDPFTDFNRKERANQYEKLSTPERITLSSSRLFLGNKFSRTFVFFYVLVLHLLVFSTLWHFTHVSHGACDDDGGDHGTASAVAGYQRLIPPHLRGQSGAAT